MEFDARSTARIARTRQQHIGKNLSLNYQSSEAGALHVVRGEGCWLMDAAGHRYLDCVNNVAVLGHAHPKVVQAVSSQLSVLNTNSRYLHQALADYTEELLATFPQELQVLYMVNSGSEANDLALRIATTTRPGATHVVVMGSAYHGHTGALIDLSPYKFWGAGGAGRKPHVHVIPCPDPYRGEHCDGRAAARAVVAEVHAAGGRVAAFYAESVLSCGGQIILPQGYLQAVYEVMHEEGAVCVADEVQCGFGRVGEAFWGFSTQGVIPDIVTMGKPMGNGYPVAGLVTTSALADAFANGMEYFNTFGGSTGASVAALTTLRCLREEDRQQHAQQVGQYLMSRLREVKAQHPDLIGDVRGIGLMAGLDIVRDPTSRAHAPAMAKWIKDKCRSHRVLLSTDGPYDNVIKIKPPLVFGTREVDILVETLRHVLSVDLTHAVRTEVEAQEQTVWARVYGPRMAQYRANEAALGLTPAHSTSCGQQAVSAITGLEHQQQQQLPLVKPMPQGLAYARMVRGAPGYGVEVPQLTVAATSHGRSEGSAVPRSRL